MHLSHSGLQQLLECPASYFLTKKQGISAKKLSTALDIGSAFHWGCEHNTEDLQGFLNEQDKYQLENYDFQKDITMATGMVHGYLMRKDNLFKQILTGYNGEELHILEEHHELDLVENLPSYAYETPHEFHGIVDLLIKTELGWILLDYKTSSQAIQKDTYRDQILRYVWMLKQEFPDIPVYKCGLINVKKTSIRLKQNEAWENYLMRIKREYESNDDDKITYLQFEQEDFSEERMNLYIANLSRMCDFAQMIEEGNHWFINYKNATSIYGKSEYWDYFYKTPDAYLLYKVRDPMWNDDMNCVTDYRDATPLDMLALEKPILNHFVDFKKELEFCVEKAETDEVKADLTKKYGQRAVDDYDGCVVDEFNDYIHKVYGIDEELLDKYWNEYFRLQDEEANK